MKYDVCLHNSRRELVAACEATSTTGLILFRAFVEALGGLDPCRNGRKRYVANMVQMATERERDRHKQHQSTVFFGTQCSGPPAILVVDTTSMDAYASVVYPLKGTCTHKCLEGRAPRNVTVSREQNNYETDDVCCVARAKHKTQHTKNLRKMHRL